MASTIAAPLALSEAAAGAGAACSAMIETLADAASWSVRRASREALRPSELALLWVAGIIAAGSSVGRQSRAPRRATAASAGLACCPACPVPASALASPVAVAECSRAGRGDVAATAASAATLAGLRRQASRRWRAADRRVAAARDCCSSSVPSAPAASAAFDLLRRSDLGICRVRRAFVSRTRGCRPAWTGARWERSS